MPGATAVMAVALFGPAVYDSADTYSAPKLLGGMISGSAWANFTCARGWTPQQRIRPDEFSHRGKGLLIRFTVAVQPVVCVVVHGHGCRSVCPQKTESCEHRKNSEDSAYCCDARVLRVAPAETLT